MTLSKKILQLIHINIFNRRAWQTEPDPNCFGGRHFCFVGMATAQGQRRVGDHGVRGRLQGSGQHVLVQRQLVHSQDHYKGGLC